MRNFVVLGSFASIVVILAGLRAASGIVVPFLLAMFLAIIISPALDLLEKFKIPRIIAFVITCVLVFGVLIFFGRIVVSTLADFTSQLPKLQQEFKELFDSFINKLNSYGLLNINNELISFDPNVIFQNLSKILRKMSSFFSMSFFIFLLISFMLFETGSLKKKIAYLDRNNPQTRIFIDNFVTNLKKYLLIKTIASVTTGALIGVLLWVLNIPYAALWGITACILNYIPTIGSIVAAIPTIFIALITADLGSAVWVIIVYLTVNVIIGNIIEPRFLGEGLGISTILVLASLLLWGYIFGIGGLFLAIPLTMTIQIALASNPKTHTIALLLSSDIKKHYIKK